MCEAMNSVANKDTLAVWGGQFEATQWAEFLNQWQKQWPVAEKRWGMWEFVSDFQINEGEPPQAEQFPLLERAELFGKSGHLSCRREENLIYWHFVGCKKLTIPSGYGNRNYWDEDEHASEEFFQLGRSMLLWGERVREAVKETDKEVYKWTDSWFDDRVGWAELKYPHVLPPPNDDAERQFAAAEQKKQRVQANYCQFTRAGQVAFVWLTSLEEYSAEGE